MKLRILNHNYFTGSYNQQFINNIDSNTLENLLNDIECNRHTLFGEIEQKIHTSLSKNAFIALAFKVSNLLDGKLVRKTAEECRLAFDIIRLYYNFDDIKKLKFIYEHLREHFKYSRNPMPSLKFKDTPTK